jgi:peptidoglycan/LPS O-acetylase OafA/YrhL
LTFERLRPADWVVFVAALALLFTTAPDWYSTTRGEEARQIQKNAGGPGQVEREVEHDAGALAESQERNAWQEDGLIDRIILIGLLTTSALGVAAAFWRASGRGSDGLGAFGLAGLSACVMALLVLYRIIQEPGFDSITTVKAGAPLALGVLGVMAFACATSLRDETRAEAREARPAT